MPHLKNAPFSTLFSKFSLGGSRPPDPQIFQYNIASMHNIVYDTPGWRRPTEIKKVWASLTYGNLSFRK